MSPAVSVAIHPSQFPAAVRRDLVESLRNRRVNHKFHYDSVKQTHRWLALHEAYSPARTDTDCQAIYERAFAGLSGRLAAGRVHVIGLGCGGGQKDVQLLRLLGGRGVRASYAPGDVSLPMVLVAREAAVTVVGETDCFPFVCDLAKAGDLAAWLAPRMPPAPRVVTFFGMIPNFLPEEILPKLAALVGADDWLLFSANLAPGAEYAAGMTRILPQYDNALTRRWLLTLLLDLGVELADGELRFAVEDCGSLKRVVARFEFARERRLEVEGEEVKFQAGETIQVFYSFRYTPDRLRAMLLNHGLSVSEQWISRSEEEGVFLCRRTDGMNPGGG